MYAVAETKEIKSNSGISLWADDVIANLKGHEDEYDALVFSCGDAVPIFQENANKPYNIDLMEVIKAFGDKGKLMDRTLCGSNDVCISQELPMVKNYLYTHWQSRPSKTVKQQMRNQKLTVISSRHKMKTPSGQ